DRRRRTRGAARDARALRLGARRRPAGEGRLMARPIPETPRLLLGTGSLLGVSRATRDRTLQVATRFAEPESLAVTISKALKAGAAGVVASPSRSLRQALAELPESVPAYALL